MKVRLVAYGIAREILNAKTQDFEFKGNSIGDLKDSLIATFPEFRKLRSLSFAVGERYQPDSWGLSENDEVVVIPPVSGG